MKYTSGGLVGAASGSLAGTVFSRNHYGQYVRNRAIPVQPLTQRQQDVRSWMTVLVDAWANSLNAGDRAEWTLYGQNVALVDALGNPIHLPGKEHYIRSNLPRLQAGLGRIDDGPTTFSLPPHDSTIVATATESDQNIAISWTGSPTWASVVGAALLVKVGRPQNPVRNFYNGPWRFGDSIDGAASPPTSPIDVLSPFPFSVGQLLYVELRVTKEDGRLSTPFQITDIAAA